MKYKGILIPIGGNEDKGKNEDDRHRLDFVKDGILSRIVLESGGEDAKIVIIPTASSIPVEVGDNYINAFKKLGCTDLKVLDIRTREQADSLESIEVIRGADCIMFSGGDQSKIAEFISGSNIHAVMRERLMNERIVIGGTSAGAMAMSQEMIRGGSVAESLLVGSVLMGQGLGFMSQLIIDTHFIGRGRFGRVAEAVGHFPDLLGIGLAEDTGIVIENGEDFTVIGSGMVILFDGQHLAHNNAAILKEGTPMTMVNLVTHILSVGDKFNLATRQVSVLPFENDM